ARGGPKGWGWNVVTPSVPVIARRVVHTRERASAPQAPILQIAASPAHSSEYPIDIDSESEDFTEGETEEETEDME
ncbi:hypothetical protein KI387_034069, partial [Taxus chinensis]